MRIVGRWRWLVERPAEKWIDLGLVLRPLWPRSTGHHWRRALRNPQSLLTLPVAPSSFRSLPRNGNSRRGARRANGFRGLGQYSRMSPDGGVANFAASFVSDCWRATALVYDR